MSRLTTAYGLFNLAEGLLWLTLGCTLFYKDRHESFSNLRWLLFLCLLGFACTDFAEVSLQTKLPGWLFYSKLLLGPSIFFLLNYREHLQSGPIPRVHLVMRGIVFLAMLSSYWKIASP